MKQMIYSSMSKKVSKYTSVEDDLYTLQDAIIHAQTIIRDMEYKCVDNPDLGEQLRIIHDNLEEEIDRIYQIL